MLAGGFPSSQRIRTVAHGFTELLAAKLRRRNFQGGPQMIRALIALLLILGHVPVAAAARRRAVQHPAAAIPPAAIVTAASQAAEAALKAGVPAVQIAVSHRGRSSTQRHSA